MLILLYLGRKRTRDDSFVKVITLLEVEFVEILIMCACHEMYSPLNAYISLAFGN